MDQKHLLGLRGGAVIRELLLQNEVRHIFGYTGGAALPLFDGLYKTTSPEFILVHHEQGAGHMAEGYARASGKPGVVFVTSGPGVTNLVTPLYDAFLDGTPLVVIAGEVSRRAQGTGAFQEIDVMELVKPCTKWRTCVRNVGDLPAAVNTAFYHATAGRPGPVFLAIPVDVGNGIFDEDAAKYALNDVFQGGGRGYLTRQGSSSNTSAIISLHEHIDHVAALINRSHNPIICAGQGAMFSRGGPALLRQLSEKARIPVTNSLLGLGSFNQHNPLSLGMIGVYGTPPANLAIQNADLVLVLGARLDERAVGKASEFARRAREQEKAGTGGIFQFDISAEFVGKVVTPTELILGDLTDTLSPIISQLDEKAGRGRTEWLDRIAGWKEQYKLRLPSHALTQPYPLPQEVILELSRQCQEVEGRVTVSTGVGQHQMWTAKYYELRHPRSLITSGGLGTMGFGLPAAIGALVAHPGSTVIDVDGDASFCMAMAELLTAKQHNLPVKAIILNNHEQGMITECQEADYGSRFCFNVQDNPDFVALARSMHCQGRRCASRGELADSIRWLLGCKGPAVLEVPIPATEMVPKAVEGGALDEMRL